MWRAEDMLLFLADTLTRSANLCTDWSAITHKLIASTIHHAGKWPRHICSVVQVFSPISWSSPPSALSHWCDVNCLARHYMVKKHKVILCPLSSFGFDSFDKTVHHEKQERRVNLETSCSCLRMATIFSADADWKANQKWSVSFDSLRLTNFREGRFPSKDQRQSSSVTTATEADTFPGFLFQCLSDTVVTTCLFPICIINEVVNIVSPQTVDLWRLRSSHTLCCCHAWPVSTMINIRLLQLKFADRSSSTRIA